MKRLLLLILPVLALAACSETVPRECWKGSGTPWVYDDCGPDEQRGGDRSGTPDRTPPSDDPKDPPSNPPVEPPSGPPNDPPSGPPSDPPSGPPSDGPKDPNTDNNGINGTPNAGPGGSEGHEKSPVDGDNPKRGNGPKT